MTYTLYKKKHSSSQSGSNVRVQLALYLQSFIISFYSTLHNFSLNPVITVIYDGYQLTLLVLKLSVQ
jgi:hypothetical protein